MPYRELRKLLRTEWTLNLIVVAPHWETTSPSSTIMTAAVSIESAYFLATASASDDQPRLSGVLTPVQCFPGYSLFSPAGVLPVAAECEDARAKNEINAVSRETRIGLAVGVIGHP